MFEMPSTVFTWGSVRLDQPDAFDGLHRAADVVLVAGGAGKHQRVEDDVLGANAVLLRQQLEAPLGDGELALAREGLRLQLVFVDAADHQRRAVAARHRARRARTSLRRPRG